MNDELNELADDYRELKAPPWLATRVRAEVRNRPVRNHGWLPVATTAALAAAIIGLGPLLWQSTAGPEDRPTRPSLTAIAAIKVEKPATTTVPSLSSVRTLKAPKMPAKPAIRRPEAPKEQTNSTIDDFEERNHAHT